MGCNCKTKKVKSEAGDVSEAKGPNKLITFVGYILISVLITLLLPLIWIVLLVMVYKSSYGEGWDITNAMVSLFKKKDKVEEDNLEDINPDDYEVVGVDKII